MGDLVLKMLGSRRSLAYKTWGAVYLIICPCITSFLSISKVGRRGLHWPGALLPLTFGAPADILSSADSRDRPGSLAQQSRLLFSLLIARSP